MGRGAVPYCGSNRIGSGTGRYRGVGVCAVRGTDAGEDGVFVCRLLQIRRVAVRVVEEGKTQPKILAAELRWQRRERSRRCNSAISRTVKRHISGAVYVTKSGDLTVFQNCELD